MGTSASTGVGRMGRLLSIVLGDGIVEGLLAAAILVLSQIERSGADWVPLVLDLVVAAGAAISGRWLVPGGLVAGVGLSAWLFIPWERPTLGGAAVLVVVFAAAAQGRFRTGLRLTFWYLPVMLIAIIRWMAPGPSAALFNTGFLALLSGLAWATGGLLHQRDAKVDRVTGQYQARLAGQRLELARDLHDTLAQTVTGMVVSTEAVRARLGSDCPSEVAVDIERTLRLGRQSIADLRAMLSVLRAPGAGSEAVSGWTPQPVPQVLNQQLAELKDHGLSVSTIVEGDPDILPPSLRSCLAKLVVEATTNMAKHATPGGHCSIMIDMDSTGVEAVFSNPCLAHPGRPSKGGLGLLGATERVQALGGHLDVRASGTQWVLAATIPAAGEQGSGHVRG